MENPFERMPSQRPQALKQEAPERDFESEMRHEVNEVLHHLIMSSIGEGNDGIVTELGGRMAEYCLKYHKIEYDDREYRMLKKAYESQLAVPRPIMEIPDKHSFVMERINGKTLEDLMKTGLTFSSDVVDEVYDVAKEFCQKISHNDLHPRNIMIEDLVIEDGIVMEGTPIIIDLGKSHEGASDEYQRVKGWFKGKRLLS